MDRGPQKGGWFKLDAEGRGGPSFVAQIETDLCPAVNCDRLIETANNLTTLDYP